jgi:hypothetical protein
VNADLPVPPPPGLGGGKHPSSSAHISKGSLASTVGSSSRDTRNTSHGSAGTPRFGGCLMTGKLGDSIGLPLVLGQIGVNILNDV